MRLILKPSPYQIHTTPPTPKKEKHHVEQDTSGFDIVKATQYGAFDRVQLIIEGGFDVNQRDEVRSSLFATLLLT